MKKIMLSMSLMLAALALTNCTNVDVEDAINVGNNSGDGVTITVNAESRATVDGKAVVWQEGDAISFGSLAEGSTYTTACLYDYVYISDNKFRNEGGSAFTGNHTFYALWPVVHKSTSTNYAEVYTANETTKTPQTSQKYHNVGKTLIQNGNSNADHVLAESPMYWKSDANVAFEDINVTLKHTTSLMKFTIVNNHTEAITVTGLKMIAPEGVNISGTYYVNLETGALVASGANYVSNEATVSVENGTAIAAGESMDVYMPVAPFALAADDVITITVTTGEGYLLNLEKTMTAAKTFAAGKLNTATVDFKNPSLTKTYNTVAEFVADVKADADLNMTGSVVYGYVTGIAADAANMSYGTVIISDNTGEKNSGIAFYNTNGLVKHSKLSVGDYLKIDLTNSAIGTFKGRTQITGTLPDDVKIEIDGDENHLIYKEISIADYLADAEAYNCVYMKFTGLKPVAASVGANAATEIKLTDNTSELTVTNNSKWGVGLANTICDLTGDLYAIGYTVDGAAGVVPMLEKDIVDFFAPCVISPARVTFDSVAGTQVITATVREGYTITNIAVADNDWLTVVPDASSNSASASATENTTGAARETTVNVTVTNTINTVVMPVTVIQRAAGATVTPATYTLTFPDGNSEKVSGYTSAWTATMDDKVWDIANFNNYNNGWAYIKCGRKSDASTAHIATSWAVEEEMAQMKITVGALSNSDKITSASLIVATDSTFGGVVETIPVTLAAGEVVVDITTPTANCYYKLEIVMTPTGKTGNVQINKVVLTNE